MRTRDFRLRSFFTLAVTVVLCIGATAASEQNSLPSEDARPIAVLPLKNRSQKGAPLREIRALMMEMMAARGLDMLDDEVLANFMRRHRMRYTAGLSPEMALTIGAETGSWAVLITSLDLYEEREPPRVGLTSRLVTTEDPPRIIWMSSTAQVGDQAPGAFDMGLIPELDVVQGRVLFELTASLAGERPASTRKAQRRFRPAAHYASPDFPVVPDSTARVAVLPFANDSTRRYAGEILTDQLIGQLVEVGANVVEPGLVRQVMLESRQFYSEGPSVPETDLLRLHLSADVVVFGEVTRYEEKLGPQSAQVEFLVRAIDTETGQLIWASNSYAGGNKGVSFFGAGRVHAAQTLATEMTRALVDTVLRERAKMAKKH
jgi:TolB-like protein